MESTASKQFGRVRARTRARVSVSWGRRLPAAMQVTRVKARVSIGADGAASSRPSAAVPRSALSMYAEPPNEELTLEDFEVLAFERLKGAFRPRDAAPPRWWHVASRGGDTDVHFVPCLRRP